MKAEISDGVVFRIRIAERHISKLNVNPFCRHRDSDATIPARSDPFRLAQLRHLKIILMNVIQSICKTGQRRGKRGDRRKIQHKIPRRHGAVKEKNDKINVGAAVAQKIQKIVTGADAESAPLNRAVDGAMLSLASSDVEINPRFYRGKRKSFSDEKNGELDASRKLHGIIKAV